jgi:hypothetical protein
VWCRGLTRCPVKAETAGPNPVIPVSGFTHGITLIPPGTSFTALAGLVSGKGEMP